MSKHATRQIQSPRNRGGFVLLCPPMDTVSRSCLAGPTLESGAATKKYPVAAFQQPQDAGPSGGACQPAPAWQVFPKQDKCSRTAVQLALSIQGMEALQQVLACCACGQFSACCGAYVRKTHRRIGRAALVERYLAAAQGAGAVVVNRQGCLVFVAGARCHGAASEVSSALLGCPGVQSPLGSFAHADGTVWSIVQANVYLSRTK